MINQESRPVAGFAVSVALLMGLVVGVSTLFAVTRSLVAAVLLDNMMATVGFATRDLTLPLPPATSLLLALLAVAAFAAAFAWARGATAASPSPAPR